MNTIQTQGVVLRSTNTNESDRMLTIFSPEMGKLSVLARGCRKPRSRFLSAAQLFCFSEFVLTKYRDLYILTQADVQNAYFDLRSDLERLAYGTYLLNLAEEAVNAGEGNYRLFALLLQALSYLSYGSIAPADVTAVYELKFLDIIGYRPELEGCIHCGGIPSPGMVFSLEGGVICSSCREEGTGRFFPISLGTIQTMRHILNMDMEGIRILKFYPELRSQMHKILPAFISEKMDKKFKSRAYLDKLQA